MQRVVSRNIALTRDIGASPRVTCDSISHDDSSCSCKCTNGINLDRPFRYFLGTYGTTHGSDLASQIAACTLREKELSSQVETCTTRDKYTIGQLDACLIREKDSTSQVEICAAHEKRAVDQVVACKKDISSQVEIYAAREKRAIDQRTACTLREKDSSSQAEICAARENRAADQLAACKKVASEQSEIYAARENRVAEQLEFCTARGNDLVGKLGSSAAREKDMLSQLDASVAQRKSLDDQLKAVRKLTVLHALKKAEIKAQSAELAGKPLLYTFKGCYPDTDARIFNAASKTGYYGMSIDYCATYCKSFKYFGTGDGDGCYCGRQLEIAAIATEECDWPCKGDILEMCGAKMRLSVYENIEM